MIPFILKKFRFTCFILLNLLVWMFFNPFLAIIMFYIFTFIYILHSFILLKLIPNDNSLNLHPVDLAVFNKYHVYLRYPNTSVIRAAALSFIQIIIPIIGLIIAYKLSFLHLIPLVLLFLSAAYLAPFFHPFLFLYLAQSKEFDVIREAELMSLDSIIDDIKKQKFAEINQK